MENMTLGNQEEDMMGHGHKARQPSAAALKAVEYFVWEGIESGEVSLEFGGRSTVSVYMESMERAEQLRDELRAEYARALDAYTAAALEAAYQRVRRPERTEDDQITPEILKQVIEVAYRFEEVQEWEEALADADFLQIWASRAIVKLNQIASAYKDREAAAALTDKGRNSPTRD